MNKKRVLISSIIGNALEFYDFTLYGVFAAILAAHFFPSDNPSVSLLASWGAFAAGFIMRPFGAAVFGHIGDRFGRRKALSISIVVMGVPTFIIGCLPSYQTIGILAPICLILCRLLQGLCTGGEYNGAAIFALEHLKKHPGLVGGFITGSCVVGALAATGIGSYFIRAGMPSDIWRVAFWAGALISILGFYIRRKISETPEFLAYKEKNVQREGLPILKAIKHHTQPIMMTILSGGLNGALSYTLFGFMNTYLHHYKGMPLSQAMQLNLIGLIVFMLSSPLMGYFSDRFKTGTYFLYATVGVACFIFPVFALLQQEALLLVVMGQIGLGFLTGAIAGPQHSFLQVLFPVEDRYSGVSFGFCTGMAIGGGCAPMFMTYLITLTSNLYVPAIYILAYAGLCFTALYSFKAKRQKLQFRHA